NGDRDPSFNGASPSGLAWSVGASGAQATATAVGPDGTIFVGGFGLRAGSNLDFVVSQVSPAGSLQGTAIDSFGGASSSDQLTGLAYNPISGKVVAVGGSTGNFRVANYTPGAGGPTLANSTVI